MVRGRRLLYTCDDVLVLTGNFKKPKGGSLSQSFCSTPSSVLWSASKKCCRNNSSSSSSSSNKLKHPSSETCRIKKENHERKGNKKEEREEKDMLQISSKNKPGWFLDFPHIINALSYPRTPISRKELLVVFQFKDVARAKLKHTHTHTYIYS